MLTQYSIEVDRGVPIPMRDGVHLFADIYRPSTPGQYPVILQRIPYGRILACPFAIRAAGAGYVVVLQDTRGRFESEGTFHAFKTEQPDGFDTCAWLCEQPWSNGRIGMFGASYVGLTQWQAALAGAPGLQAIAPNVTASDYHEGWCYQGGAFELSFAKSWVLTNLGPDTARRRAEVDPARQRDLETFWDRCDNMFADYDIMPLAGDPLLSDIAPYYDEWLAHPDHGPFWDQYKVDNRWNELDLAVLHLGGWYDIFLGGTIVNYLGMRRDAKTERARNAQHLLIGPWDHLTIMNLNPVGQYDPGMRSWHDVIDFYGIHLRFFDRYLRDMENGFDAEKRVRIFVMGDNAWRTEDEWPPRSAAPTHFYFDSHGRANTLDGDGVLSTAVPAATSRPDHYIFDPLNPVPSAGGAQCCNEAMSEAGQYDQRHVEIRPDVLCYTTHPLETATEVTGPVTVTLYASSSAVDTDFTAKLVDVCPCGDIVNITDGIIRARYRNSMSAPELMTPGTVYPFTIDLWATSHVFKAGHQIRVEISSSNFPRFDRNPNTGGVIATTHRDECVVAHQTVHHSTAYPSHITLPIVPR